jgi:Domain of unknown function (DUF4145)
VNAGQTAGPALAPDASRIADLIAARSITEILHFTTNKGLLGIMTTRMLKSRELLSADKYLENIYTPNAAYRREAPEYWRYVNLSITAVNARFFAIARVGRTLEGLCALQGVNKGVLHKSLQQLRDDRRLDPRLFEWADELRVLRNHGAHYTAKQVSRERCCRCDRTV